MEGTEEASLRVLASRRRRSSRKERHAGEARKVCAASFMGENIGSQFDEWKVTARDMTSIAAVAMRSPALPIAHFSLASAFSTLFRSI